MSFKKDLTKFQKRAIDKCVKVKELSALDLFSSIVLETPVDKGVLRNNWFASLGAASSERTDSKDKSGQGTIARIKSILSATNLESDVYMTNNLPYVIPIEFDGISGKAPEGMVRVNTLRWDSIVAANTKKVKNAR